MIQKYHAIRMQVDLRKRMVLCAAAGLDRGRRPEIWQPVNI